MHESIPSVRKRSWVSRGGVSFILVLMFVAGSAVSRAGEPEGASPASKATAVDPASSPSPEGKAKAEAKSDPSYLSLGKGFEIRLYGHLRLDGAWDDAETNNGNTAMWVKRDQDKEELNLTPRHTRIGLDFKGPKTFGVSPTGKIEVDFYGKGSNSEVLENLRLRHAFLKFDLGSGFSLLAGQWFDLHGRLFMRTLNTAVGWNHGNLCFRRPQVRLSEKIALGKKASILAEAGLARAIGKMNGGDLDGADPKNDDGEDAARPDVQLNVTLSFPSPGGGKKPVQLMFGGHYGQEHLKTVPRFIESWSWVAGLAFPLGKVFRLEGEVWMGSDIDAYRGGINQGYNAAKDREVLSRGGFLQAVVGPLGPLTLATGAGVDDPHNSHVPTNKPSLNRSFFANAKLRVCKGGWIGLEFQRFWTEYRRSDTAMSNRIQVTFYLKY